MNLITTPPETSTYEPRERARPWSKWGRRGKVTHQDLLALTHQMAATLGSGLSFGASMEILLLPGVHKAATREVVEQLSEKVSDGCPLSVALASRPDVFDDLFVGLVEAGEASAQLPEVLTRLAEFQENRENLKHQIVGSLLYPVFVLVFGVLMAAGLLAYGAPIVEEMYHSAGVELPWFSSIVIAFGRWLSSLSWLLIATGLAAVPILKYLWTKESVRFRAHEFLLNWNVTSHLAQQATTARCARTLSVLYGNGVEILKALNLTGKTSGNLVYRELFGRTSEAVRDGAKLSLPLMCSPYFPSMAAGMIAAGEEAGNLPEMLDHIADFYESQVRFAINALTKFLEPVLIIMVGGLIGTIVVALGIPFMNLVSVMS